jgi:predicted 2-oxoglutarate/Fe(II)-dependent dioxygenase YbiX
MSPESVARDISDLLSADKGYTVKKGFLSPSEADAYRLESEKFLAMSTAIYKKIHRYCKHDYIWSEDGKVVPGVFTYRIYQSLSCQHSKPTEEIFQRMLSLRDRIEGTWLSNAQYRGIRQDQYDYAQVTSYGKASPGIDKHCDYQGKAPYPLLQCLIFLTRPGVDYTGGDLILYTKGGDKVNVQATLKLEKGDALLFDKSLYHEVEPTLPSEISEVGRWTAVIGARYPSPALKARVKRLLSGIAAKMTKTVLVLRRFALY